MKTTRVISLLFAAAMLLLAFTGCQPKSADTPAALTLDDLIPTDKLVIYISEINESRMQSLISRYKKLYDVEVEVVYIAGTDGYIKYTERVTGDLAAGTGPDVLFLNCLYMDIPKAALNNNFIDLTDILAGDEEFSEDDYMAGVFDAGCFNGRQYIIPTTFSLTSFLSVQSKLEEIGFSWESVQKTSDFLEEIARLTPYAEQYSGFAQMLSSKNLF